MCCCASPNINGQPGYRWQPGDLTMTHQAAPPVVPEDEAVVYDEPGRCGGLDAHSHHFIVTHRGLLRWKHGGGEGAVRISGWPMVRTTLHALDSNARYWLLHALYQAYADGHRRGADEATTRWYSAIVEKRIKLSRRGGVVSARIVGDPSCR
jgi:hypothetical protein